LIISDSGGHNKSREKTVNSANIAQISRSSHAFSTASAMVIFPNLCFPQTVAVSIHKPENTARGILWMLATMFLFIVLDSLMKLALAHHSLVQVTWGRFFFATIFAALYCGRELPALAKSKHPAAQLGRSIFLTATTALFNAGIISQALPTATTIMFLTPILTTLLSILVLGESVGIRRWLGIAVGFLGAIIVVQPWRAASGTLEIGVLLLLTATFTNACYQIVTRKVRLDDPRTSLLFTAAFGAVATSLLLPWHWTAPTATGWAMLIGCGFVGAASHLCIIQAFRSAPASVVAPFSYSSLIWASSAGYLIWGDIPKPEVLLGAALIIAAGLYIFFRERKKNPDS
jgi:drug/metabolite transporter (DMT)-like permease